MLRVSGLIILGQFATEQKLSVACDRVIKSISDMILVLRVEIESLKQQIDSLIDENPTLNRNRELLLSIKGIGNVMARELVYFILS